MRISTIEYFGLLALVFRVIMEPKKSKGSNAKMKTWLNEGPFVEAYILPSKVVRQAVATGEFKAFKGMKKELEEKSCSKQCAHYHANYKARGVPACYVNQLRQTTNVLNKVAKEGALEYEVNDFTLRMSAFGDVSRLNEKGRSRVFELLTHARVRLAYTAGWREQKMKVFRFHMQASCSSVAEALEATRLGWSPFLSGEEGDRMELARALNHQKVYACPPKAMDPKSAIGCTTCPVGCNGERVIYVKNH